jgi:hypothetical protein
MLNDKIESAISGLRAWMFDKLLDFKSLFLDSS